MGGKGNRKLKNFFIYNDLQLRMISSSLIYMVMVVFIMLAVVLLPVIQNMLTAESLDVQYVAAQTFLLMTKRLVPALIVMFIMIFIHQVVLSHRICGPLVNFTKTFKKISEGDLTRKVYLRHGDYLKRECQRINDMIDKFSALINRIKSDNDRLVSVLEEVISHIEDLDTRKKTEQTLSVVKREAELIMDDLSVFKLPEDKAPSPAPSLETGRSDR